MPHPVRSATGCPPGPPPSPAVDPGGGRGAPAGRCPGTSDRGCPRPRTASATPSPPDRGGGRRRRGGVRGRAPSVLLRLRGLAGGRRVGGGKAVVGETFRPAAADRRPAPQRTPPLRHPRPPALLVVAVEVDHHPVVHASEPVGAGGVGVEQRERPGAAAGVHPRPPRLAGGVEAARGDAGEFARLGPTRTARDGTVTLGDRGRAVHVRPSRVGSSLASSTGKGKTMVWLRSPAISCSATR